MTALPVGWVRMDHPETEGTADSPADVFSVIWEPLGWEIVESNPAATPANTAVHAITAETVDDLPAAEDHAYEVAVIGTADELVAYQSNGAAWVALTVTGGGLAGAHAVEHASAGSDPVTLAQSQISGLVAALAAKAVPADITTHAGLPDPHGDRGYTDAQITAALASVGDWRASVQLATTGNVTLSGEQTIDGVLTAASRVLVHLQSSGAENGIYVTAAGAWSRATDFDASGEATAGATFAVSAGTAGAGNIYTLTTVSATLGTTPLVFTPVNTGDLEAANNLSDVPSPSTARTNLAVPGKAATETVSGAWTFSTSPLIPDPTLDTHPAPKLWVESLVTTAVADFDAGGVVYATTPGTSTSTTAGTGQQTLLTAPVAAGLVVATDRLFLSVFGYSTITAGTPTQTVEVKVGGTVLFTWTTPAYTANANPFHWRIDVEILAVSNTTVKAHCDYINCGQALDGELAALNQLRSASGTRTGTPTVPSLTAGFDVTLHNTMSTSGPTCTVVGGYLLLVKG